MKICAISDMHGNLQDIDIPEADLLVIAGDLIPLSIQSYLKQSYKWFKQKFLPWLQSLPVEQVVFIAGNHDMLVNNKDRMDSITPIIDGIKSDKIKYYKESKCYPFHNIVFANYLALTNMNDNVNGETFNISVEDNPISLVDLVNMLYSKLNKEPNYILSDIKQMGDFDLNWEDITKAKNILGYNVLVNMEDGITSHIKYKLG